MTLFAAKLAPSAEKLRGGYYTPEPVARFIASWVAAAGPRTLEPSCGDGAVLRHLTTHSSLALGIELHAEEAAKAAQHGRVENADFFAWFGQGEHGAFDGVAGNPPYIRFGNWTDEHRRPAFDLMTAHGLRPSRYTNAWVPFVVASVLALREHGRAALVVPAELLQVGYAAQLRAWLIDQCSRITIVSFRKLLFDGVLQEVVVLLAERGAGPAMIGTIELQDADALAAADIDAPHLTRAPLHADEKWTKYYLPADDIERIRKLRRASTFVPIGDLASVNVGVVTGRNSFFCFVPSRARELGVEDQTVPIVTRSAQLTGITHTAADMARLDRGNTATRLFVPSSDVTLATHPAVRSYVQLGETENVHTGYKCRIRREWWRVPSVQVPDGFMLRQISTAPRIVANEAGATSTDTIHRVFTRDGVDIRRLAAGAVNSITFALSEITGRSYGGGILELEPSEAVALLVPQPSAVPLELITTVDELVRAQRVDEALDLVDEEVLHQRLGVSRSTSAEFRRVWRRLRDRRLDRGASVPSQPTDIAGSLDAELAGAL